MSTSNPSNPPKGSKTTQTTREAQRIASSSKKVGNKPTFQTIPLACQPPDSPIKAIRRKCMECTSGQRQLIKYCTAFDCQLWFHRMGKRPSSTAAKRPELFDVEHVRSMSLKGGQQ
jgi:hypothetical protein